MGYERTEGEGHWQHYITV